MIAVTFALPSESSAFLRSPAGAGRAGRTRTLFPARCTDARSAFCTRAWEKKPRARACARFLARAHAGTVDQRGFRRRAAAIDWHVGDIFFAENFSDARTWTSLRRSIAAPATLATAPAMVDAARRTRSTRARRRGCGRYGNGIHRGTLARRLTCRCSRCARSATRPPPHSRAAACSVRCAATAHAVSRRSSGILFVIPPPLRG